MIWLLLDPYSEFCSALKAKQESGAVSTEEKRFRYHFVVIFGIKYKNIRILMQKICHYESH